MTMLNRWPLVYVEWLDHEAEGAWSDEAGDHASLPVAASVGWLLFENDIVIVLVSSQCQQNEDIGNKQKIIKSTIVKRVTLKKKSKE